MSKILCLNGPNLNLLGRREPDQYGRQTLDAIERRLGGLGAELGHEVVFLQSNDEASLLETIQSVPDRGIEFLLFNPAAFTHTSIALRDALLAVGVPFIEIHLSNIHSREQFRQKSYFSDIAVGVISGLGGRGYELALRAAHDYLSHNDLNTA